MPLYVKGHSQGEYVFDYGWADAFERAGGQLLPEAQVAVPFSPVPGPRLLLRPGRVADGGARRADRRAAPSLRAARPLLRPRHLLHRGRVASAGEAGWLQRIGTQFHWNNEGYRQLRRLPGRAVLAQAQGDPQGREAAQASG